MYKRQISQMAGTDLYLSNVTGTFQDAQQESISVGGVTAVVDSYTAAVGRYLINGKLFQTLKIRGQS